MIAFQLIVESRLILIGFNKKSDTIFSVNKTRAIIAFCWIFSFGLTLIPLFRLWGQFIIVPGTLYCGLMPLDGSSSRLFLLSFGFIHPVITIVITYSLIWLKIRRHDRQFTETVVYRRNFQFFKVILVIFSCFLACYLPNLIQRGFLTYSPKFPYFRKLTAIIMWSNVCINPIIYFAMNREYLKALRRFIRVPERRQSTMSADRVIK